MSADRSPPTFSLRELAAARAGERAIALIQVIVAMAMIVLCGGAGVLALLQINQKAAAMRLMNNARAVLQRNIDMVGALPFNREVTPEILVLTPDGGMVYDDDGGNDKLAYSEGNQAFLQSVTFLNLNDSDQIPLITSAREKDFAEAAERSFQIIRTWQEMLPGDARPARGS
ncbi:MAG: hypothetical protein QOE70_6708 [Chthoniobacter sp.]|jgi:hypothetical protein|nr:hypothetical protein [Chthoniobacter sp.]